MPEHADDPDDARELAEAARARRARDAALTPGERIERAAELIKQAQELAPAERRPQR